MRPIALVLALVPSAAWAQFVAPPEAGHTCVSGCGGSSGSGSSQTYHESEADRRRRIEQHMKDLREREEYDRWLRQRHRDEEAGRDLIHSKELFNQFVKEREAAEARARAESPPLYRPVKPRAMSNSAADRAQCITEILALGRQAGGLPWLPAGDLAGQSMVYAGQRAFDGRGGAACTGGGVPRFTPTPPTISEWEQQQLIKQLPGLALIAADLEQRAARTEREAAEAHGATAADRRSLLEAQRRELEDARRQLDFARRQADDAERKVAAERARLGTQPLGPAPEHEKPIDDDLSIFLRARAEADAKLNESRETLDATTARQANESAARTRTEEQLASDADARAAEAKRKRAEADRALAEAAGKLGVRTP